MRIMLDTATRRFDIDDVQEAGAVINNGLSIGYGVDGFSLLLTSVNKPGVMFQYSWEDILVRLIPPEYLK